MKRITFILAVAAALCAFSSCKKNTDTGAQEVTIFGTWQQEKLVIEYVADYSAGSSSYKAGETEENTVEELGYTYTLVFNEDYSSKTILTIGGNTREASGKFTYDETTKVISYIADGNITSKETVESLTATELRIKVELTTDGKLYAYRTEFFKKVK